MGLTIVMSENATPKKTVIGKKSKPGATKKTKAKVPAAHPSYAEMVTKAISEQKEKKGSSLMAIKKFVCSKYPVDVQKAPGVVLRTVRKMEKDGRLIAGAKDGKKGAGCFKIAPEEKLRLKKEEKA